MVPVAVDDELEYVGDRTNSIPVIKALYTEAFKALQHVSVVGIMMKDC
jgi:hypothetical protein